MVPSGQLAPATRPDLPTAEIDLLDLGDLAPEPGGAARPCSTRIC
ncbi:hypothetical protein ABZ807_12060 [Micromonospora sp. NPDC047548]